MSNHRDIYDPRFVSGLFDEMSKTYGTVNLISSFGFSQRWRKQCVKAFDIHRGSSILDLMAGMAELSPDLSRVVGSDGRIIALDISSLMCEKANQQAERLDTTITINVINGNALQCPVPNNSVDHVISSFGLKTFNSEQLELLAREVYRVLKPGGSYSFLEISIPSSYLMKIPYLFYLKYMIPIIGRIFMGNPDNYRLLGVYTKAFADCRLSDEMFRNAGLNTQYSSYFFGCATGVSGVKDQ